MKQFSFKLLASLSVSFLLSLSSFSQNSILVNFGSSTCSTPENPSFSLINNPLGATPSVLADCNVAPQLPDYFNVYIAYNPKDNKLYIADIRSGIDSKIWVLDVGLPGNLACPATIPVDPTYSYSYISNNFEFDNNGDLWSLNSYDITTGLSSLDKIDVATGTILETKILQFPLDNPPNTILSGDITITPNGRMFATLGSFPSRLYEITNYNGGSGNATATYLQLMPDNTYGIAYLNGQLEITGNNSVDACYYYDYNIATNTLGQQKIFQNQLSPIDNTSITPALGTTKQLVNATLVNSNTADLTYEIYVRNLGNALINNINVTDDLGSVFGAANISNLTTSFVPGFNAAGLTLNTSFNGTTITNLLNPGQNLTNQTLNNTDYFFKIQVKCRVTNLTTQVVYNNTAIGSGNIGSNLSAVNVADSSNNGPLNVVDPNNNGNAGDVGENVPTPFLFGSLVPVRFISVNASLTDPSKSLIKWTIATADINASKFEVEYSRDGRNWNSIGELSITSRLKTNYLFEHTGIPTGNIYYRIKQIDIDGSYVYSRIVLLNNNKKGNHFVVFPNPANHFIQVTAPYGITGKSNIELLDATGRKLAEEKMEMSTAEINTTHLPNGTYILRITNGDEVKTQKVLIMH